MKNIIFTCSATLFFGSVCGQVGINTENPSATLDIVNNDHRAKILEVNDTQNDEILTVFERGIVGINAPDPNLSADLHLGTRDKAIVLNHTFDPENIAHPTTGMLVYDETLHCFRGFQGNPGEWSNCFVGNTTSNPPTGPEEGKCGAYLGPNQTNWKEFACHNLGADISLDPYMPQWEIFGSKYQWGAYKNEYGRYYEQNGSSQAPATYWNTNPLPESSWNVSNPCAAELGAGWRLPTTEEWQLAFNINSIELTVNWDNLRVGINIGEHLPIPMASFISPDGRYGTHEVHLNYG